MSDAVFPVMPGLTWDITREPFWSTTIKTTVSGREFRSANFSYPRYRHKMVYSVLRQTALLPEMAQLAGFFNARNGSFDSFLFTDPDDCAVTAQTAGVGDGTNKVFQLVRTFGGYVEPVFDVNGAASIFDNAAAPGAYTLSKGGLITFAAAPVAGHTISWSGAYYRRMRFAADAAQFNQFMAKLWNLQTLELLSVKP